MDDPVIEGLLGLGRRVRDRVHRGLSIDRDAAWADPAGRGAGDLQYRIDAYGEAGLLDAIRECLPGEGALRVLSEGLPEAGVVLRPGSGGRLLVVDPIDGTRGLMHDKRSAFFLAGLAPDGAAPRFRDLEAAVMVEIPTTRSVLSDVVFARRGGGAAGFVEDLRTGERTPLALRPSGAVDLRHGFASVSRFFGGAKAALGAFDDALLQRLHPGDGAAGAEIFEDQYISNGGQLHALITGRDRFVADLRPLFSGPGGARLLAAHPYDLLGALVAEEAGVVVTDPAGGPLDFPLDLTTDVAFVAYASEGLRARVEPAVRAALADVGVTTAADRPDGGR